MRYAISDIHGGSRTFRALLDRLDLKHTDRLYLLGDYVDRGNDSKGVLDTIWNLINAGYDVRPIRGNHDDMFHRVLMGDHDQFSPFWYGSWGANTLASFDVRDATEVPLRYLTLLDALPMSVSDDDFVFVHAALDMELEDPVGQTNDVTMLWGDCPSVPDGKLDNKTLVSGHRIRPLPLIEVSMLTNRILLDNGAFTNDQPDMGNLVALNLDEMQLHIQPWLDGEALP